MKMQPRTKSRWQRYEVVSNEQTLRVFRKSADETDVLAFAREASRTCIKTVCVDAVSTNGRTGQRTTCIASFKAGERV